MKLYFMKQSALDYITANIRGLYINYFREKNNQWIYDLFDYDPFELFMEVPDFELAPITRRRGETELENCRILYSKLINVSESQASDERLWAGLCNGTFYEYVRRRWDYDNLPLRDARKDSEPVLSRFFFKGGVSSGKFRNTLSKCWWVGHGVYQYKKDNRFELLDALGADDFSTKVTDIFYSYTFSSNFTIVSGIIKGWREMIDKGYKLPTRSYLRPTVQYINALGGGVLLDVFDENEIKKITVDYITFLYEGKDLIVTEEENDDDFYGEEDRIEDSELY